MKQKLRDIFRKKTVIVGIGNTMKGDDGFGPLLVNRLRGKVSMALIDAGSAPENYVGVIAKEEPQSVLLVDSAHLGSAPGTYEVLEGCDIVKSGFTTHDISTGMFIEYLKERTKAEVFLLGVEPQNIAMGLGLSEVLNKTLDKVELLIREAANA